MYQDLMELTEEERNSIRKVIEDIVDQKIKIDAMRSYINDAKSALAEEYNLSKKDINQMITLCYNDNAAEHFEHQDDLHHAFNTLFKQNKDEN